MKTSGASALSKGNFVKAKDDSQTLKPYLIYLTVEGRSSSNIKVKMSFDDDESTAIEFVTDEQSGAAATDCYDLTGRKATEATKGIVIRNGVKILVK